MNPFVHLPAWQIAALWKAASATDAAAARGALYWLCVEALRAQGFAGDARRFIERAAKWQR